MNYIADGLLYILNFKQLELYAQKQHNKRASIETIKEKTIKGILIRFIWNNWFVKCNGFG